MNVAANIPLILGVIAGILFVSLFVGATYIVFRNRRIIKNWTARQTIRKEKGEDECKC